MAELVYGAEAAIVVLRHAGAGMSVTAFKKFHLPHLIRAGHARPINARLWAFDPAPLAIWGRYVAEVRRRKAAGELGGQYEFNEQDVQAHAAGAW